MMTRRVRFSSASASATFASATRMSGLLRSACWIISSSLVFGGASLAGLSPGTFGCSALVPSSFLASPGPAWPNARPATVRTTPNANVLIHRTCIAILLFLAFFFQGNGNEVVLGGDHQVLCLGFAKGVVLAADPRRVVALFEVKFGGLAVEFGAVIPAVQRLVFHG